jgi:leader peptidase (prepilin peptidase) / N-methyltransferase
MDTNLAHFVTQFPWFFPPVVFVFGAMIGSFLNVVIYRVPKGESIVHPGSHCSCGQAIAWYDNIPIFSWFLLRGKARCCGQAYSPRYAFVELLTGVLFLASWLSHPPLVALAGMVMLSLLVAATFIDLDHMIIPDGITIWGTVAAVAIAATIPALHDYDTAPLYLLGSIRSGFTAVVGALIGSALILWIGLLAEAVLRKEAMGFGDVKFMGLIGAFLGWQGAIFAIFGGAIVGTVWFVVALLIAKLTGGKSSGKLRAETPNGEATDLAMGAQVPFGPMLAIAAAIYWFVGHRIMTPYIDQVLAIW